MRALSPFAAALLCGVLFPGAADAATLYKTINRNPANACALSIPTTNTGVRPKATGFRNEGGVTNFVICSFDIETSSEGFYSLSLYFASFDNQAHTFDCTAMDRYAFTVTGDYSTKSVSLAANVINYVTWSPADFPVTGLLGWNASVTCQLPPGVSIVSMTAGHMTEVGN